MRTRTVVSVAILICLLGGYPGWTEASEFGRSVSERVYTSCIKAGNDSAECDKRVRPIVKQEQREFEQKLKDRRKEAAKQRGKERLRLLRWQAEQREKERKRLEQERKRQEKQRELVRQARERALEEQRKQREEQRRVLEVLQQQRELELRQQQNQEQRQHHQRLEALEQERLNLERQRVNESRSDTIIIEQQRGMTTTDCHTFGNNTSCTTW